MKKKSSVVAFAVTVVAWLTAVVLGCLDKNVGFCVLAFVAAASAFYLVISEYRAARMWR